MVFEMIHPQVTSGVLRMQHRKYSLEASSYYSCAIYRYTHSSVTGQLDVIFLIYFGYLLLLLLLLGVIISFRIGRKRILYTALLEAYGANASSKCENDKIDEINPFCV